MEEKNTENVKKTRKDLYISVGLVVAGIIVLVFAFYFSGITGEVVSEENGMKEFNDCLADNGMAIYGSKTCPHCKQLVESLGGYDATSSVYVECTEDQQRCSEEAKTGYVPEIQIDGEVYEGGRAVEDLAETTGCEVQK